MPQTQSIHPLQPLSHLAFVPIAVTIIQSCHTSQSSTCPEQSSAQSPWVIHKPAELRSKQLSISQSPTMRPASPMTSLHFKNFASPNKILIFPNTEIFLSSLLLSFIQLKFLVHPLSRAPCQIYAYSGEQKQAVLVLTEIIKYTLHSLQKLVQMSLYEVFITLGSNISSFLGFLIYSFTTFVISCLYLFTLPSFCICVFPKHQHTALYQNLSHLNISCLFWGEWVFCFFFFGPAMQHEGSQFLCQGSNPCLCSGRTKYQPQDCTVSSISNHLQLLNYAFFTTHNNMSRVFFPFSLFPFKAQRCTKLWLSVSHLLSALECVYELTNENI